MKRNHKRRSRAGFTLAETLMAVIILLLVSTIVATGVPAARNAYEKVVLGANAQMLLSTTVSALRNELGTAYGEITASGAQIVYCSAATGAMARLYLEDDAIMRQNYYAGGGIVQSGVAADGTGADTLLLSKANAETQDLRVVFDGTEGIRYDAASGIVTFPKLVVKRASNGNTLASLGGDGDLKIRLNFADRKKQASPADEGGEGNAEEP